MNILFLTKELPYPANNGHRTRSQNLIRGLARHNKVNMVCLGNEKRDKEGIEAIEKFGASVKMIPGNENLVKWKLYWFVLLGLFSSMPFVIRRRYSTLMRKEIRNLLAKNNIDLVVCDSLYQTPYIPLNTCNKILCEHNIESMIIYRYFKLEKNIIKKLYALIELLKMRRFESKMWRKFNCSLVVSQKDKEIIKSRLKKENIEIIPNGVDINYFCPGDNEVKPFSLIYTGQMDWYPNEDAVIYFIAEIYPLIKRQIPEVSFWIVGNNPSHRIRKLARADKSIIVTGAVDDIRPYVSSAEIVIVPLRIASGTRLKILEAMAMGKPVVSTSIGCEGLDVTGGENILMADEPGDFAQEVIELFSNPPLVKRVGAAGRRLAEEKYSWEKILEGLNGIVNQESSRNDNSA